MTQEVRDYNGPGDWSADAVLRRYAECCRRLRQAPRELRPREHTEGSVRWIYPIMREVIAGISSGDAACVELAVEFVESSHKQPFGRILHANAARALRRAPLSESQVTRLRRRILGMLVAGQVPHEYHEYAKLLRRVGVGGSWPEARRAVDTENAYVMRYVRYFERCGEVGGLPGNRAAEACKEDGT